jgi:2-oxoisovalerate dehydrogenase E1 component subunit alpha
LKTVASFEIGYQQYLDPDGRPVQDLPEFAQDQDTMLALYRAMSLTRVFDTKAIALQRTGQLGTYASCLGHEATHCGIGAAMIEADVFCPMYREYGAQMLRGVKMSEILLFWGGDERGNDFSGPAHDFPWCVPIATQYLHAAGAATALKYNGVHGAAVSVIGDGGTSQGDFYEALNVAGAWQLPTVFVVANNKWAISVPIEAQTACETLAQKGIAAGIPSLQVDGNDIVAMRQVMGEALERARSGGGPTLVEAMTYRLSDHTTADDASRYRPNEEVEENWAKEPLIRIRQYLLDQGWWDEAREEALLAECRAEVDVAVEDYKSVGKPPITDMFDHMFAQMPESLAEQRKMAIDAEASHG